jgi:hypothetical protein
MQEVEVATYRSTKLSRVKNATSKRDTLAFPTAATPKYPHHCSSPLLPTSTIPTPVFTMASLATKTQSQNVFTKLKQKPANKVRLYNRRRWIDN